MDIIIIIIIIIIICMCIHFFAAHPLHCNFECPSCYRIGSPNFWWPWTLGTGQAWTCRTTTTDTGRMSCRRCTLCWAIPPWKDCFPMLRYIPVTCYLDSWLKFCSNYINKCMHAHRHMHARTLTPFCPPTFLPLWHGLCHRILNEIDLRNSDCSWSPRY